MAETTSKAFGWDDEIEFTESNFEFPEGEYDFIVDHFERAIVGGDGTYAGQNMAKVVCKIQLPENGQAQLTTNMILNEKFAWKLSQFFVCIGDMKGEKNERLRMDWNNVAGKRGRCKVEKKPNYSDATKSHMEITSFLKPVAKDWSASDF